MSNTRVKYFDSSMAGAPVMSGLAGTLIAVLDACLINGFNPVTVNSLVINNNTVTATVTNGHGLFLIGSTGPVIRLSGVTTPSALNGDWRVATIPNSTTFTFFTTGISNQTATGTVTAKVAPADFSKPFSGTNIAVYRSNDIAGNRRYWKVDDSLGNYAGSSAYEAMSGVSTGTLFASGLFINKSYVADNQVQNWRLITDSKMVYLFTSTRSALTDAYMEPHFFGDWKSFATDVWSTLLAGASSGGVYWNQDNSLRITNNTTGKILARSYTGASAAVAGSFYGLGNLNYLGQSGNNMLDVYPSPVDGLVHLDPINVYQGLSDNGYLRGVLPGAYSPRHRFSGAFQPVIHETTLGTGLLLNIGNSNMDAAAGSILVNITGPWS